MLCKCHWIVLYIVHFTAFYLGGGVSGHGVSIEMMHRCSTENWGDCDKKK